MSFRKGHIFKQNYPQNYLIQNPVVGGLVLMLFTIAFTAIYRPLGSHASLGISYLETMALYSFILGFAAILIIYFMKLFPFFSDRHAWNLKKEIAAIGITLVGLGITIYLAAFIIEPPADRWNLSTFIDSIKNAFLVGILPFSFFTAINISALKASEIKNETPALSEHKAFTNVEKPIFITSQLKKESLSFIPSQLLYAESDGNYVRFCLIKDENMIEKTIRNSISNVEKQLSGYPEFFRTHRAFIVNLKKVQRKLGNSAGYRLKLSDAETEIPVSRQKSRELDSVLNSNVDKPQYKQ